MSDTVLVVGASGLVGSALFREFKPCVPVIGTYCRSVAPTLIHLDLRDQAEVRSVLRNVRPSVVLCPAAEPNVELCEADPVATGRTNVEGLRNLLVATAEIRALLVYFSSEYVFDGTKGSYSEDDVCAPLNTYGRQKLECERLQRLNVNTSWRRFGKRSGSSAVRTAPRPYSTSSARRSWTRCDGSVSLGRSLTGDCRYFVKLQNLFGQV